MTIKSVKDATLSLLEVLPTFVSRTVRGAEGYIVPFQLAGVRAGKVARALDGELYELDLMEGRIEIAARKADLLVKQSALTEENFVNTDGEEDLSSFFSEEPTK